MALTGFVSVLRLFRGKNDLLGLSVSDAGTTRIVSQNCDNDIEPRDVKHGDIFTSS